MPPTATAPIVATQPPPPPVNDGKPVDVNLQVEARIDGKTSMVLSGQTLHSGDEIALYVSVTEPAYLYLALASADGDRNLLFPAAEPELVGPGSLRRVPAEGKWFRLDKDTGNEDIFAYASRKPLTREDVIARLKADADHAAGQRKKAQHLATRPKNKPGSSPKGHTDDPGSLTPETRGLDVVDDTTAPSGDGIIRKHFTIKHAR
jgi:hypothetical protein